MIEDFLFHEKQNSEVDENYIYRIPVLLVWYSSEVLYNFAGH